VPDAGQRASAPAPRAPTGRAGTLLIYSKGFDKRIVDLYNEAHFASTGKTKEIDSWPEIMAAIGQYQSINHLVFLVHSKPGMFLFRPDANARMFGDYKPLVDAAKELKLLPVKPQIQTVDLAGCNLGFHLDGVLQFGLATTASEIIATNHFHEFALMPLKARPGEAKKIDGLDKDLARLRGYVVTPNADTLVDRAKDAGVDKLVLLEWFAGSAEEHRLMLPNGAGINTDKRAKVFKRYSDTFNVVAWDVAALDAVKEDFFKFYDAGGPPVTTLTRVTIELQQFRETTDSGQRPQPAVQPRDSGPQGDVAPRREAAPRRVLPAGDRSRRPPVSGFAGYTRLQKFLEPSDQAIVDEVFRRGGSVGDAMGVFYARNLIALKRTDLGVPPLGTTAVPPLSPAANPSRGTTRPRFTLEDRLSSDERDLSDTQQRRTDQVEALRPLIEARLKAYEASVKIEFNSLRSDVRRNFQPIKVAPYIDPDTTADEKYRRMRGAYYRAGWTCMKRDVFDKIVPTTFFGTTIGGGAHSELSELLRQVEQAVRASNPGVADQLKAGGFDIGGFVPRFQAGSNQLSNHSWGLAIDSDATWNPQLKSPKARAAFKQATGDDIARAAYPASSADAVDKTYDRIAKMSKHLMEWLNKWMPKYDQLQEDRRNARAKKDDQKLAALREAAAKPELAALQTLIDEYKIKTVQSWRAYGIVTIPKDIVKAFLRLGKKNGARWGGQYEDTKDIMHLELQWLGPGSLSRPGGPGRRKAVSGFDDLVRGETPREPRCPLPVHAPPLKPQPRPATQPPPSTKGRIQLG
jgi:hypothetical protein